MTTINKTICLKNGTIIDGSGQKRFHGDLYIKNGKIVKKPKPKSKSKSKSKSNINKIPFNEIDCGGLIVAPGFIDVHTHSDDGLFYDRYLYSSAMQGVTTEIVGNCGWGFVPLANKKCREKFFDGTIKLYGFTWRNYEEYKQKILIPGVSLNLGLLVGHNNLRLSIMGEDRTKAHSKDILKMCDLLASYFEDGAMGLSTGLAYYPSQFAEIDELIQLAKVCKKYGKVFTFHMRNEGLKLCESIKEVIHISKTTGCRVQISHFKTSGAKAWRSIDEAIKLIKDARANGIKVYCDRYPYLSGVTGLLYNVPYKYYKDGMDNFFKKITDKSVRELIQKEMNISDEKKFFSRIVCADFKEKKYHQYRGQSLDEIAKKMRIKNCWDLFWELILENKADVMCFFFTMCEKNLRKILKEDYVCVASDKMLSTLEGPLSLQLPHPRFYGTFSRFIGRYVNRLKLLSLEEGIHKCSGLPAKAFNLKKRGLLKEGYFADVVVFDEKKYIDKATYKKPRRYSSGVKYLFVNGEMVIDDGVHSGSMPGVILGK